MKRIISLALVLVILMGTTLFAVYADKYTTDDIDTLYYDFEVPSHFIETYFTNPDKLCYWSYVNDMDEQSLASKLIGVCNDAIKETPDKKYYMEVLTNLITLMECNTANQVETQSQFDDLKDLDDYAMDIADIGATVIGMEFKDSEIAKTIGKLNKTVKFMDKSIDNIKYYEATIKSYDNAEQFLKAVADNTEIEALADAAFELRTVNTLLFEERLNLVESTVKATGFSMTNFITKFGMSIIKSTETYKTDELVQWMVGIYDDLAKIVSTATKSGKFTFKVIMLGANLYLGTNNTFRRHNEMKAMADIAESIIKANDKVTISKTDSAQSLYSNIRLKCEYYRMLLTVHLRGEYLIYSLIYNDAGALSFLSREVDNYINGESGTTIEDWYHQQTDFINKYYEIIDNIYKNLYKQKYVVHEGFELHNGFIREVYQKTEVPEGYIGIYSYEDFKKIADSCPASTTKYTSLNYGLTEETQASYILMNDIALPAGYETALGFYGVLDGNGYTISGIQKPLFSVIGDPVIKNLGLQVNYTDDLKDGECDYGVVARAFCEFEDMTSDIPNYKARIDNCYITGSINITCRFGTFGGFIGSGMGIDTHNVEITNCYNSANISIKTRQDSNVGGICGEAVDISNCFNSGNISLYTSFENTINVKYCDANVGGIVGHNDGSRLSNCYNTGDISLRTALRCEGRSGGIAGDGYWTVDKSYITNCYNLGTVSATCAQSQDPEKIDISFYSGGIIGSAGSNIIIQSCFNEGAINGEDGAGGIAGHHGDMSDDYDRFCIIDCYNTGSVSADLCAGGMVGDMSRSGIYKVENAGIKNCYNTGSVNNATEKGALAGKLLDGKKSIENSYFTNDGMSAIGDLTAYEQAHKIDTEELKKPETFEGFDFSMVWKLHEGDSAPQLRQLN